MAREVGWLEGAINGWIVSIPGNVSLGIKRLRKQHDLTPKHVIHGRTFVVAILIRTEGVIVAHVEIGTAELEGVTTLHPRQAPGFLIDVLRSTDIQTAPQASARQIARKRDLISGGCEAIQVAVVLPAWSCSGSFAQRKLGVNSVVGSTQLGKDVRGEAVRKGCYDVLRKRCRRSAERRIGADTSRAHRIVGFCVGISRKEARLAAVLVVDSACGQPSVLRSSTACVHGSPK